MALDRVVGFTGDRDWSTERVVAGCLENLSIGGTPARTLVVCGGARGLDTMAEKWAKHYGFAVARVDANWDSYRKAAGPIRNQWMLDMLLLFPAGKRELVGFHNDLRGSNGTLDMVKRTHKAGVLWSVYNQDNAMTFSHHLRPLPWE